MCISRSKACHLQIHDRFFVTLVKIFFWFLCGNKVLLYAMMVYLSRYSWIDSFNVSLFSMQAVCLFLQFPNQIGELIVFNNFLFCESFFFIFFFSQFSEKTRIEFICQKSWRCSKFTPISVEGCWNGDSFRIEKVDTCESWGNANFLPVTHSYTISEPPCFRLGVAKHSFNFYVVQATAGLRALGAETSERILQAVILFFFLHWLSYFLTFLLSPVSFSFSLYCHFSQTLRLRFRWFLNLINWLQHKTLQVKDFLHEKSSLKFKPEWVSVLDGTQEGAFQWVRYIVIIYLLFDSVVLSFFLGQSICSQWESNRQ